MKTLNTLIIALLSASIIFISSCGPKEGEVDPIKDSLKNEIGNRDSKISEKEQAIQEFVNSFNEISANLDEIKAKEKIIQGNATGADVKSKEDQIKEDIQSIYNLLQKNKSRVGSLNKKLKESNVKMEGLEKMIATLEKMIAEKDGQIEDLKNKIESLNIEIGNLEANYAALDKESTDKTVVINTVYYCMGTGKELKTKGVTTKEGGILGMGKTITLKADFNKEYFTKADMTELTSIPIGSKNAKVLTNHPSSSYKLVGEKPVEKIEITNPTDFWSASKYLVIITE